MNQPTLLIGQVYAIEVPESGTAPFFDGRQSIGFMLDGELRFIHLPSPANWQLIGTTKEVTEEQAKEIVERTHAGGFGRSGEEFKNYVKPSPVCFTSLASLRSLLTSKGLDQNKNYVLIKKVA